MNDRDLQVSYWFLTLRPLLRRIGLLALLLAILGLLVLTALQGVRALGARAEYERLIAGLSANTLGFFGAMSRLAPPQLNVKKTAVLQGTPDSYTIAAIVQNPSSSWLLTKATYAMRFSGQELATGTTAFLPGEEKYLLGTVAGKAPQGSAERAEVAFSDFRWQRVQPRTRLQQVKLTVEDAAYRILTAQANEQLSQVTATLVNGTVVSVPEAHVVALLYSGTTIIAASELRVTDLEALERRPIDLRFYQALNVTNVTVRAGVDALENVVLAPAVR